MIQGYYNEISNFIDAAEGLRHQNLTSFESVRDTYEIICKIKET